MKLSTELFFVLAATCAFFTTGKADAGNSAQKLEETNKAETVPYSSPNIRSGSVYIAEHFDNVHEFKRKWKVSKAKKPDVSEDLAQYNGEWNLLPLEKFPLKGDTGLVLVTESRHAAIAAKFDKPFVFDGKKKFIVQYVVTFQKTVDCGGAYIKLLTDGSLKDLSLFNDKTPYTIMFGPDKCGGVSKMHFIIRHKHPINGTIIEKHCTKLKVDDAMYKDQEPYLLKLVIEPNNDFSVYINNEMQYQGNLLSDDTFNPPINPPKEIVDESDVKPENWDDRAKIPDPSATKPDDWDENEPAEILDPNAVKPEGWLDDEPLTVPDKTVEKPADWDEEMDGDWAPPSIDNPLCKEAPGCGPWSHPMIANPKFKGKWTPPMIENPNFKGKWMPKKIPNPDYYYDDTPLKSSPIGFIGFELWSLVNNMYFDDILVTDSEAVSQDWVEKTWALKKKSIAAESITFRGRVLKALNFSPGWWMVYGIYCIIPISIYILYMRQVLKKVSKIISPIVARPLPVSFASIASFYKMFLDYTNTYPWLWAVYVLVLAVVVGLIGTFCFRTRKNKDDFEKELLHKKTDDHHEDESEQVEEDGDTKDDVRKYSTTTSEESDPDEKNSKPSSGEEEEEEDEEEEGEEEASVAQVSEKQEVPAPPSPRRRRPRRD